MCQECHFFCGTTYSSRGQKDLILHFANRWRVRILILALFILTNSRIIVTKDYCAAFCFALMILFSLMI